MSTFAEQARKFPKTPPGKVVLEPSAFASDWSGRPRESVCFGLRMLSEAENASSAGEAAKMAVDLHDGSDEIGVGLYNDCLILLTVTAALCDPNDYTKQPEGFPLQDPQAFKQALTSAALGYVFEAVQRMTVEVSPAHKEADEEDLAFLSSRSVDILLADSSDARAARKHLRFAAALLSEELGEPEI